MRVSLKFLVAALIVSLAMSAFAFGPASQGATAQVEQRYLVLGRSGRLPADFETLIQSVGGRVLMMFPEIGVALVASADPSFPTAASALPGIQSVVPDGEMTVGSSADIGSGVVSEVSVEPEGAVGEGVGVPAIHPNQWNLNRIDVAEAWSRGYLGQGVQIAVLDTGIDYLHQELAGKVNMVLSRSLVPEVVPGRAPFADTHVHGTHVASVIAGKGVRVPGVAPQAELISVKVLDKKGTGQESTVIAGILYAASLKVDIINMSLGFVVPRREPNQSEAHHRWVRSQQLEALQRALNYAARSGALMVASAGNSGTNWDLEKDDVKAPAGVRPVVGVSATTNSDALAPYSDYGRRLVYVAAPGGGLPTAAGISIYGAANTFYFPPRMVNGQLMFAYLFMSGTSQAAATVSGVAALADSKIDGRLPGLLLRFILARRSEDLGPRGRDAFFGYGLVNAGKAVGQRHWPRHLWDRDDDP
ncbi:MAG: S8 family serine peptidase [Armatimonadota bacterium]|nr:S8 family serine peptidase [Armatimonadota bacterium]MDR7492644.1 S8 family serine peptidase [Armatimonadota bacterium]MDR7499994.1 S8 family serine peptidase [Armatimonadota bacterium]MDR7504199.1 S8 family serine peptidase [Armatimonadota bacterium]MDR7546904.1 S8 family serine peptidase [Armatimonadota bacterium]